MIATPLAGAAFGEVFYRTANLIRDDSTTGLERVGREVAACIFNPVSFVDRLLTGKLWKVNPSAGLYHDRNRFPVSLSLTLGDRYMSDGGDLSVGGHYPTLKIGLSYGDAFDTAENAPFSYFKGSTYMHLGSSNTQPLFGYVGITGRLWGMDIDTGSEASEGVFGIFQQGNICPAALKNQYGGRIQFTVQPFRNRCRWTRTYVPPKGRQGYFDTVAFC